MIRLIQPIRFSAFVKGSSIFATGGCFVVRIRIMIKMPHTNQLIEINAIGISISHAILATCQIDAPKSHKQYVHHLIVLLVIGLTWLLIAQSNRQMQQDVK